MCPTCENRFCHVQLAGNSLESLTSYVLKRYLKECSVVEPLHVIKSEATSFALVHFASQTDAATFYHVYCIQKKLICIRLEDVEVNPSLIGNQPVDYSTFQVQPRISSSTEVICRCRRFNGSNNTTTTTGNVDDELDSNTDTTTTADTTTTNAGTTTTTNANTNAAINDDDEWDVDIQNLKVKYTQALKRKELEMEKVADEISKLQKKLRYLEDMERL
ncbi:hypothetical protein G6F42_008397 [Rhizopus arrhizus]|nr:hypothetical protein G6F42_008397 [Rhizopus arrhizus]